MTAASPRPQARVRPAYLLLGGLILGILLANALSIPPLLLFIAGAVLLVIAVVFSQKESQSTASALLLVAPFVAVGAGLARQATLPTANDVSILAANGPSIWIEGVVASDPAIHPSGSVSFVLNAHAVNDFQAIRPASGRIQVVIARPDDDAAVPLPGDSLWLRGRVEEPPGVTNPDGFDERAFLARRGIHSTIVVRRSSDVRSEIRASGGAATLARILLTARDRTITTIDSHLDADDAAVLSSLLLSEHAWLSADTKNAYERTGALHILSVSGLHLAAVAAALSWLLGPVFGVSRRIANPIIVAVLWTFALASGGGVAASRAAIVFSIVLMAPVLRRSVADPVHSLAVAAFVLLVASPLSLYDPGFQLSFATIAVLMLWLPALERLLLPWEPGQSRRASVTRYILAALLAGLVAQIGAWPLVAYYFNVLSVVSPMVSLLVAPLAVILLLLGLVTVSLATILPGALMLPFWAALHALLHLLHLVVYSFSVFSFAAWSVLSPSAFWIVIYYALLGGGAIRVRKSILQKRFPRLGGWSGPAPPGAPYGGAAAPTP